MHDLGEGCGPRGGIQSLKHTRYARELALWIPPQGQTLDKTAPLSILRETLFAQMSIIGKVDYRFQCAKEATAFTQSIR